jgi:hypothetical protein
MSVRRASTQLLAQRSVHIRIVPRPANIGESREIFRILQRFGEMTMYKHLRVCSPALHAYVPFARLTLTPAPPSE